MRNRRRLTLIVFFTLLPPAAAVAAFAVQARRSPSDHFDGVHFFNHEATPRNQLKDFLRKLQPGRKRGVWHDWEDMPQDTPPRRVDDGALRVTFVNHATVLIQMNGLNILTDPNWATRLAPLPGGLLKRHRPVGIRFEDLPPIDVVLISHNHFDHMDIGTLKRLSAAFHPRIITGLGNSAYLRANGVPGAQDVDWWDTVELADSAHGGVRIRSVPARHWSARELNDVDHTLWMGFVIESNDGDVYFAGDTGYTRDFDVIREHYEQAGRLPFRLALLPIAPGHPHDAMSSRHMDAADAVKAYHTVGAAAAIGIHFGTFKQGDDGQDDPAMELDSEVRAARPCVVDFVALNNGEARLIPRIMRGVVSDCR